ncbi:MAG: TlpA disulfide reductase family protein [Terriglobales bacterium]
MRLSLQKPRNFNLPSNVHYKMTIRYLAILLFLSSLSFADLTIDVRTALSQGNFTAATAELEQYRVAHGVDPDYLEALSWMARASLSADQLDQAATYALQIETLAHAQLQHRALDAEPHLPLALGAAIEVQAQVLAAQGQQAQAVALLRHNLTIYRDTSLRSRLQKNLNMLDLAGQPAPPLSAAEYFGPKPKPLTSLRGSPVLLFFWAHWCIDCKHEGPIIAQLSSEFASRGLTVLAPTQLYGYAAQGQDAKPKDELAYAEQVWQHFYPGLQHVPVPVSKANFDRYGASTTPTLVLIDRKGHVALYHPGVISYDDLRAAIERAM